MLATPRGVSDASRRCKQHPSRCASDAQFLLPYHAPPDQPLEGSCLQLPEAFRTPPGAASSAPPGAQRCRIPSSTTAPSRRPTNPWRGVLATPRGVPDASRRCLQRPSRCAQRCRIPSSTTAPSRRPTNPWRGVACNSQRRSGRLQALQAAPLQVCPAVQNSFFRTTRRRPILGGELLATPRGVSDASRRCKQRPPGVPAVQNSFFRTELPRVARPTLEGSSLQLPEAFQTPPGAASSAVQLLRAKRDSSLTIPERL